MNAQQTESLKSILMSNYQLAFKADALKINKAISEISWLGDAHTEHVELLGKTSSHVVTSLKLAKDALVKHGINNDKGELDFVLFSEEFKIHSKVNELLRQAGADLSRNAQAAYEVNASFNYA